MGIKGFYGYCNKNIKGCHRKVNIIEEIERYKSSTGDIPTLVINLWPLSYNFKLQKSDFLFGYQFNKIKSTFEDFLTKIFDAGCNLAFVVKKSASDDREFLKRSLKDYEKACSLLKDVKKLKKFEKLNTENEMPYNVLTLVALLQSAEKFGEVRGASSIACKPSVAHGHFADKLDAAWILGLDTYFFFVEGEWKIWADSKLNMEEMTVEEYDKTVVWRHFAMPAQYMQLMAVVSGDMKSDYRGKFKEHFGVANRFENLEKFVKRHPFTTIDSTLCGIAIEILGKDADAKIVDDMKEALESFTFAEVGETLQLVRDDFLSFAEEILMGERITLVANLIDLEVLDFNALVMPWINRTAGILLKNFEVGRRSVLMMKKSDKLRFEEVWIEPEEPPFEVPELKILWKGEMAEDEKIKMLSWIVGIELSEDEWKSIESQFVVDCLMLIFMINKSLLSVIEARCVLQTIVKCEQKDDLHSAFADDLPKKIDERALRCTFLYHKIYFILHSCLNSVGLRDYCSELKFDGVYFQKIYALNILDEMSLEEEECYKDEEIEIIPKDADCDQAKIVKLFKEIIHQ